MLSTKRRSASILTLKEILENGFVAAPPGCTHPSPVCSYYADSGSASRPSTLELLVDLESVTKSSSLCVLKQPEVLGSCVKPDPHSLTQGSSDISLVCLCKTPYGHAASDLSGLPSQASCLMDVASHNTSTPCKKEKHPKLLESLLSKSTEHLSDSSTPGKPPGPRWEISEIKAPLDTSLFLDTSTEELRLLGCSKPDTPSLETSVVIPLTWPGAFRRHPALPHGSATHEAQLSDLEPSSVFAHPALCCCCCRGSRPETLP